VRTRTLSLVAVLVAAAIGLSVALLMADELNPIEYGIGVAFVVGLLAAAYRQWRLGARRARGS